MAQEPETEKNASGIAHAAKRKWGYDAEQVDAFLERAHMLYEGEGAQLTQHDIQNVSFELVKGGYVIAQVDAALARLERAVVDQKLDARARRNRHQMSAVRTEEELPYQRCFVRRLLTGGADARR